MIESDIADFDLARSRARIRAALDGVITIDAEGIVVEWNPAAERIFGYSADEAVGRIMADLIVPPAMHAGHRDGMARYLASGEGRVLDQRLEMPAITADGREITIELTITSFTAGGEQWFTGWARDITDLKRTEHALAVSEQRFQAVVEHSSDVITIIDRDGNWLYTSQAGTRLTGYPKGFDPEGGIFSLLHPEDTGLALQTLQEVMAGTRGPDEPVELRIIDADGKTLRFETVGVNMLDNPAVEGVVLHARDVTERHAAEAELGLRTQQLAGVLGSIQLGVLVEDRRRHVAVVNDAFTKMFSTPVTAGELVGADCAAMAEQVKDFFLDPARFVEGIDRCIAGRAPVSEEVTLADGRVLERDYLPVLSEAGDIDGHIWMYRDVTDRKRAEEEREHMLEAERLARRSIEASQAVLEVQNRSLRELDRLKDEVVATVSHELRTPLSSIVSFGELLDDVQVGPLNDEQQEFVTTIRRNADRLIRVVNDLLLLARLESDTIALAYEPVDLADMARSVVAAYQPMAEEKGIALAIAGGSGPSGLADRERLEQVVSNLVTNAIKFTPPGGQVAVGVREIGSSHCIEVTDTGIGIPADEQEELFQRFFRASNAREATIPGTGLGLAVCHAIVRLHAGQIDVHSTEGEGSTFRVIIPARPLDDGMGYGG
ncbi:MAG: PAS domain S-box protein [Acidimicrobiia bacterium]|nr:PAS domain S-box protein [Acidimicrobiia bacterium]NNL12273.1 PAS domain S-box protein [Acidimicrobiia bacterium]